MSIYYQDESVTLHHGDARQSLAEMPDGSVDCIVTSPPYFGLRAYGDDDREIGREESPVEFIESLRAVFTEAARVLADDGTCWINIGDTWYSGRGKPGQSWGRSKSLLGIPWRLAFALMDDGWILRQEVIWAKRNCTPDPAADRPGRAHEQVFLLTKKPKYWFDAKAIREDSDPEQQAHNEKYAKVYAKHTDRADSRQPGNQNSKGIHARPGEPGRHPRSVWSVSAQPFPGDHPATMPPGVAEKCILAGCKPGGVVLDPFSGSGTTGMVAGRTGRRYVGIELNKEYLDLSIRTRLAQGVLDFGDSA